MTRRPLAAAGLAAGVWLIIATLVGAAGPVDVSVTAPARAQLGERIAVAVEVRTAPGVEVEIDPSAPSWGAVEVLEVSVTKPVPEDGRILHRITVTASSFKLGLAEASPAVIVIADGIVSAVFAPAFTIEIAPSLPAGAALELSSLPAPASVDAAETEPSLVPAIAAGVVAVVAITLVAAAALVRSLRRRRPQSRARPRAQPASEPAFPALPAEEDVLADPVGAYREMGLVVRRALTTRHGLPAGALATGEVGQRMEAAGVGRWQARLVRGLLENCDAVVYAGYRPAPDRRRADLNVAHEIIEGGT